MGVWRWRTTWASSEVGSAMTEVTRLWLSQVEGKKTSSSELLSDLHTQRQVCMHTHSDMHTQIDTHTYIHTHAHTHRHYGIHMPPPTAQLSDLTA